MVLSQINDRIFLSGTNELYDPNIMNEIQDLNIRLIISCVDRKYVDKYHQPLKVNFPNLTIIYLPYMDIPEENLWKEDAIQISKNPMIKTEVNTQGYWNNSDTRFGGSRTNPVTFQGLPMIEIGYYWMNKFLTETDGSVLVHCMAGISRSTSLIIYYLMKKYAMSYDEAYNFVKRARSIIQPNTGFEKQLRTYDTYRDKLVR
jgi:hypothetical protein